MSRLIPPIGPTNSPLLAIIGEAPGAHEEQQGKPFVGPSGWILDQMLLTAGTSRKECYITNVIQRRPPMNDFGVFYEDRKRSKPKPELQEAWVRVIQELETVRPKVIVACGSEALRALTGKSGIKKHRGSMYKKDWMRIIPTIHPAFLLRVMNDRPIVECDLSKAVRQALSPHEPQPKLTINPPFEECLKFLRSRPARVTVDIETIEFRVRCIGFAWNTNEAISIPFIKNMNENWWNLAEETLLIEALRDLLLDPSVEKVLQNGPFDLTILARELGLHAEGYVLDTMFSHHLLYPSLPKSLDFLSSIHTDFPMYWDYSFTNDFSTGRYNCMDCLVTYVSALEIERELADRDMLEFYHKNIHPAVLTLTRMQNRGVTINTKIRSEIELKTEQEMGKGLEEIKKLTGLELNPSSPKQVKDLVYNTWGLPQQRKPRTETTTADGDALNLLARKFPVHAPVLNRIVEYREKRVLLSTFCRAKLTPEGKIKTSYSPTAVTGRIKSSSTIDDYGGNLQNIPRGEFRRIFEASPGKVWIKADLSQAESRVLIWKARIRRIIERYLNDPGFSIHKWNTESIFKIPYDQVDKESKEYSNAKNGVFGANYGIGALKVSRMYNMDFQDAKFVIDNYHRYVPEVRDSYWKEIQEVLKETRTITNPLGRQIIIFGRVDEEMFRKGYAYFPQSTIADLILLACAELDAQGVELLLQVHDELDVQCPENEVLETAHKMKAAMERPLYFDGVPEPLTIPVEIKSGPNWYDLKTVEGL